MKIELEVPGTRYRPAVLLVVLCEFLPTCKCTFHPKNRVTFDRLALISASTHQNTRTRSFSALPNCVPRFAHHTPHTIATHRELCFTHAAHSSIKPALCTHFELKQSRHAVKQLTTRQRPICAYATTLRSIRRSVRFSLLPTGTTELNGSARVRHVRSTGSDCGRPTVCRLAFPLSPV